MDYAPPLCTRALTWRSLNLQGHDFIGSIFIEICYVLGSAGTAWATAVYKLTCLCPQRVQILAWPTGGWWGNVRKEGEAEKQRQ